MSILKKYKNMADGIHKMFGEKCEVVIHDFSHLEASVVYVVGNLTGRKVGAPATETLLKRIRNNQTDEDILNVKYKIDSGKLIKASTIFLRNDKGEAIGSLGISYDISNLMLIQNDIMDFLEYSDENEEDDFFTGEINKVFEKIINKHINYFNKPLIYLTKEEKLEIINKLDQDGIFLVKGGFERIAQELGVSKFTVYNYVDKLKKE